MTIKGFSCFSSGGHFVQWNKTIVATLVEGHSRNISLKLFRNWDNGLRVDIIKRFFYFVALMAILCNRAKPF